MSYPAIYKKKVFNGLEIEDVRQLSVSFLWLYVRNESETIEIRWTIMI